MAQITLENGGKITTFAPPPAGFDPLTASAAKLAHHGFPARPKNPELRARYDAVFTRMRGKLQYIVPTFRIDPNKTTHPRQAIKTAGTETSDNWSGGIVYAAAGESFSWVQGDWVVPNVYPPTDGEWYYCLNWVGLDGDGSSDVCQAGMVCAAYKSGTSISRMIYPWHEWYPQSWIEITNLAISAGDMVSVVICTSGPGSTSATVYFGNVTSGVYTSYTITAPSGTQLSGNCAEWIVETPYVGGVLTSMPDYGQVFFSSCQAGLKAGGLVNGGTGNNSNLVQSGNTLSTGTLITPTVIECRYAGSQP
jgi:Peptidase A4 family